MFCFEQKEQPMGHGWKKEELVEVAGGVGSDCSDQGWQEVDVEGGGFWKAYD